MELIERIRQDHLAARRGKTDAVASALLGTLLSEAERIGKDGGNRASTDAEATAVVRRFVKNAEQAVADLEGHGRDSSTQRREIEILRTYLPQGPSTDELRSLLRAIMDENPDKVAQAKVKPSLAGWFVGQVMRKVGAAAESSAVSAMVRDALTGE